MQYPKGHDWSGLFWAFVGLVLPIGICAYTVAPPTSEQSLGITAVLEVFGSTVLAVFVLGSLVGLIAPLFYSSVNLKDDVLTGKMALGCLSFSLIIAGVFTVAYLLFRLVK